MKKSVISVWLLLLTSVVIAQSKEDILEAYRTGMLTNSQIEQLKNQYLGTSSLVERSAPQSSRLRDAEKIEDEATQYRDTVIIAATNVGLQRDDNDLFGHSLFGGESGGFEPNLNIATPEGYVLGAGDEIIIDLWGDVQQTYRLEISPDGRVVIPDVGPISLVGLSVKAATRRLRQALSTIYEGLASGTVDMILSLGSIRSIQVSVAGEVAQPGSYTLPSLATLMHALNAAGGVSDLGSLRRVKLYRAGRQVVTADIYDYLLNGDASANVALQDGDLIIVPTYERVVKIDGKVRRPMRYEMRRGETLSDLIRFAGDFAGGADRGRIMVVRQTDDKYHSFTLDYRNMDNILMEDGDAVSIKGGINRYENRVEARGAFNREGFYAIGDSVSTVRQLIDRAGGLREDAFMSRALLYREGSDLSPEVVAIDLPMLLQGQKDDIALRANDILAVAAIEDMREDFQVGIFGAVGRSGDYPYAENMTVEDLIVAAGGLLESAATTNVTIVRRIKSPRSLRVQDQLFDIFTVDISGKLEVNVAEFVLHPFDQVFVRRSPVYIEQNSVEVRGEVPFEGRYPLMRRNMRLSEVVAEAGYPTSGAFVEGAYLMRKMTSAEQSQQNVLKSLIENQQSSGLLDTLQIADSQLSMMMYPVGINLAEALRSPGSDADVVLRDGDIISIPQYNGTVRVMGAVLYPNSVTYQDGKRLRYYVKAAGGFGNRARKRRSFVIYMNGMVESGTSTRIRPGCVVVVPSKLPLSPMRWRDVMGLLSSSASTAAVVMSAINMAN